MIIILSIIIFALIILLILFILINCKLVRDIANPHLYPCKTLYVILNFNQEEYAVYTDFSKYEKEKIIMQIINVKDPPTNEEEKFQDGKIIILEPAVVYEIGDKYLWAH